MKEKNWDDFTLEEQIRITKEYEHLNVLISAVTQGVVIMHKLDPCGAKLAVDRMNEALMSLEEKIAKNEEEND